VDTVAADGAEFMVALSADGSRLAVRGDNEPRWKRIWCVPEARSVKGNNCPVALLIPVSLLMFFWIFK